MLTDSEGLLCNVYARYFIWETVSSTLFLFFLASFNTHSAQQYLDKWNIINNDDVKEIMQNSEMAIKYQYLMDLVQADHPFCHVYLWSNQNMQAQL